MESISTFLESQPFIALFLVISLGYAFGKASVAGLSLGSGAVLFVGLAVGAIAPKAAPPGLLVSVGLCMFVYALGLQFGKNFFKGLASSFGIKANILAAVGILAGAVVAVFTARFAGIAPDFAAGVFAGATASTPAMQAAMEASGNANPSVSYAILMPFSIIIPILIFYFFNLLVKPKIDIPAPARLVIAEARASERGFSGLTIAELLQRQPEGTQLHALRRSGMNIFPDPAVVIEPEDIISFAGLPEAIAKLELGDTSEEVRADRRHLDYVRCFVSKTQFVGSKLSELEMPEGISANIIQVRRGDADLLPNPDLVIEFGDQVIVLTEASERETISKHFGDSIAAQSEFSFISLGLGFVLAALVGLIPIPIPGVGSISLGMAGGPLIVGLVLGYYGRLGPFNWTLPVVANNVFQGFGLSLFLAGVGMASGGPFVANIGEGVPFILAGLCVLVTVVVVILGVGYYLLRMNFDDVLGIVSGAMGHPAILAYANQLAPTGRPGIVFGMIVPGVGLLLKVIVAQVLFSLLASGVPPG
jgi:putative transport protein